VDVNDDGMVDDALVNLVTGDSDGDGTYDDLDTCVDLSNPDAFDLDEDSLGDTACDPDPIPCPPAPMPGCKLAESGKSSIAITDDSDDTKDGVKWKWSKGEATSLGEIGNPVTGVAHYSLCVYDTSGAQQPRLAVGVFAKSMCGANACWKAHGSKGVGYKDKAGQTDGVKQIQLTSGVDGKAKIGVNALGSGVDVPVLPPTLPVLVQLVVNEGDRKACWEATYSTFTKLSAAQFKAKSD